MGRPQPNQATGADSHSTGFGGYFLAFAPVGSSCSRNVQLQFHAEEGKFACGRCGVGCVVRRRRVHRHTHPESARGLLPPRRSAGKIGRVGLLWIECAIPVSTVVLSTRPVETLSKTLRDLGGSKADFDLERRYAAERNDACRLAAELVRRRHDRGDRHGGGRAARSRRRSPS